MRRSMIAVESLVFVLAVSMWSTSGTVGIASAVSGGHSQIILAAVPPGCQAYFSTGSGASHFVVCVTRDANLDQFITGAGGDQAINEGYAICTGNLGVTSYDLGFDESGFLTPTISQPTAGQFPLTVTRETSDGRWVLKQVWGKPDKTEQDITLTMTLTNGTGGSQQAFLFRNADFDANGQHQNAGGSTNDSVFLWPGGSIGTGAGILEESITFGTQPSAFVETEQNFYTNNSYRACTGTQPGNPATGALTTKLFYGFTLASGASKTVKIRFARL